MSITSFSNKELKETLNIRQQLDEIFKLLISKEIREMPKKNDLLDLIKLNITGGSKDISSKLDSHLYNNKRGKS